MNFSLHVKLEVPADWGGFARCTSTCVLLGIYGPDCGGNGATSPEAFPREYDSSSGEKLFNQQVNLSSPAGHPW